jgi:alpha-1,2-mannosyltransferase
VIKTPDGVQRALLVAVGLHLLLFIGSCIFQLANARGMILADGVSPIGGDFVNLYTVGHMLLAGQGDAVYDPAAYDAFQQTLIGTPIGLRLWAYPPHSLPLALPFGFMPYGVGLAAWSAIGLGALVGGARRFGFSWIETALLATSPGALLCIYWGQTGNFAAGLMLLALSQRGARDGLAVVATTILTIKPQMGYLLPVLWATGRNWGMIVAVGITVILVVGLTVLIGGVPLWQSYLSETLPQLSLLERRGSGPFMAMIPSVFMSLRLWGLDGDLALNVHLIFAALMLPFVIWLFLARREPMLRAATAMVGMAVLTPYLHVYDLVPVFAAALLIFHAYREAKDAVLGMASVVAVFAWAMPYLTLALSGRGIPITPVLMVALLVLVARAPKAA